MEIVKTELFDLFERFAIQNEKNYLTVPMQTGSGKTFTAVQFMLDFLNDFNKAEGERKYGFNRIVYATSLKNNLPWKDLQDKMSEDDFNDKVLVIKSNKDSVVKGLECITDYDKGLIKNLDLSSFNELYSLFRKLKDAEENLKFTRCMYSGQDISEYERQNRDKTVKQVEENIALISDDLQKKEWEFRKEVRSLFFRNVKEYLFLNNNPELRKMSQEEKLDFARKEVLSRNEWAWLPILYPISRTLESRIIFMSVNKLALPYDTVIGPKLLVYNSEFTENTLFMIDEVDAAKTTLVQSTLDKDNFGKFRIEPTELFRAILKSLEDVDNHPPRLYEVYRNPESDSLRAFVKDVLDSAYKIVSDFHLNKRFFLENGEGRRYVYHDYRALTIGGGLPVYELRKGKNYLDLDFEGEVPNDKIPLERLFSAMNRFFNFFASLIMKIATNLKKKEESEGQICPLDLAVRSTLDAFELPTLYDQYVEALILRLNQKTVNYFLENDYSFYNRGFRHYEVESSREHSETSKMYQTSYDVTPEKILIQLLAKNGSKLIGISATSTIYSVIANFDVEYLYAVDSPCKPYLLSDSELDELKEMYRQSIEHYDDNLRLHFGVIDGKNDPNSKIVESPILADDIMAIIDDASLRNKASNSNDSAYVEERYRRFAIMFRKFIKLSRGSEGNWPIKSMLALFNIGVKNDPRFDTNTLTLICNLILKEFPDEIDLIEKPFCILRGKSDYDNDLRIIIERLEQGKKVLIVSTYQTVGSGQNLQYRIPKGVKVVATNHFPSTGMKDIDALYLDNITNLVPMITKGAFDIRDEFIYDIEELSERGELTSKEVNQFISYAFNICAGNKAAYPFSLKSLDSVILTAIRYLAQGIGRITRTNRKNPDVFILADINLAPFFNLPMEKYGLMRSVEFDLVCDNMRKLGEEFKKRESKLSKDIASSKSAKRIDALLVGVFEGRPDSIMAYDELGELVLKNPTCGSFMTGTISPSLKTGTFYSRLATPSNSVEYKVIENDKKNTFANVIVAAPGSGIISSEDCNLDRMMRYPTIRTYFEKRGYATEFRPGRFIMSPATYNRIYKGRIGEAAGRAILESLSIKPIRMENGYYERFDDRLSEDTYIDYKNWNTCPSKEEQERELKDAFDKLASIPGARRAFVANIMKPNWDMPPIGKEIDPETGLEIINIAYLIDDDNTINHQAIAEIMKVLK